MKKFSFILMLCLFAGCSQAEKCVQYLGCPDGMDDCREQAKEICPGGYHEMSESQVGPDFAGFAQSRIGDTGGPHMVVTCD